MRPPILTPDRPSVSRSVRWPVALLDRIDADLKRRGAGANFPGWLKEAAREKLERDGARGAA